MSFIQQANVKNDEGKKVRVSKIMPTLKLGSIVSLQRNDVDYVVTEYGVAWVFIIMIKRIPLFKEL